MAPTKHAATATRTHADTMRRCYEAVPPAVVERVALRAAYSNSYEYEHTAPTEQQD